MKKSFNYKELIKDERVVKMNLKKFLKETNYFKDLADFNHGYTTDYNMNSRNSIIIKSWDKENLDIYDLNGYSLHEIIDNGISY